MEAVAAQLHAAGIGRGDPVAIVLPNGPEMATAFLAVASVATAAPLNPAYRAPEFDFYISDLEAKALIVSAEDESPAIAVADSRGIPVFRLVSDSTAEAGWFTLEFVGSPVARTEFAQEGEFATAEDVALVLHTSGTTSRPKIVPLSHKNLCVSANHIRTSLALGPEDLCLNVMPLFHIHGLLAATLSSLLAGATVACTPGFVATLFFTWLEEHRPTWFTAVPSMHQAILARAGAHGEAIAKSRLRFVRSSSSALPRPVAGELEKVFGVPVIEAYGMTEAAHQMTSNPLPPAVRKHGSVGVPAGPEVSVMNDDDGLLAPGAIGEVVIRGPNVTVGYQNNPEANTAAFTSSGWFRTGDQGYLDEEGYLFLTGRLKEIINRGGETISPFEIDDALLAHSAVAQAVAFGMPDETLGEEVAAAVVLKEGAVASEQELQSFSARRLSDWKIPRRVLIVEEIPKGPTGKLQRLGLAKKLGLGAGDGRAVADAVEYIAPRNETETVLAQIWQEVLQVERVGSLDNFLHLGGDSVLASQILARVHDQLGAELRILIFFETPTVAAMAVAVEQAGARVDEDTERLLNELEEMSEEEAERLLEEDEIG
jgi:acyl-CoA synthetase (AMP-forming)/AMP-acid ligase II